MLGDDQLRQSVGLLVFRPVVVGPVEERDEIGVLLDLTPPAL
jgi:hypothetical protein